MTGRPEHPGRAADGALDAARGDDVPGDVREVLVVELLGGLGDLLLVLPAVHALAAAHPDAAVRVLTLGVGAPLLALDPAVAEVLVARDASGPALRLRLAQVLDARRVDLLVSTTRHSDLPAVVDRAVATGRVGRAVTDLWRGPPADELVDRRYLALLVDDGVLPAVAARTPLRVALTPRERQEARHRLGRLRAPVALLVESGMAVKQWPTGRFADLAAALRAQGRDVLVPEPSSADAAAPVLAVPGVRLLPRGPLRALAADLAVVGEAGGVAVGGDTGPLRLAAAVGSPAVGVFGPTVAGRYGPPPGQGVAVQGLPGCEVRRPTAITEQDCWWSGRCPLSATGAPACLDDVAVQEVLRHLEEAVGPPRAPVRPGSAPAAVGTGSPRARQGTDRYMSDSSPEHGAGLSATGRTAADFDAGDDAPGDTYGGPRGTGTEDDEVQGGTPDGGETDEGATAEG